ncbi:MAG: diguanylate cyclase [Tenericutes bacterium]|nr:diguanylate cyclase [Mycoplasmatota bacterium]
MQAFLEILLILTAFLSVIPVVNMFRNHDNKYRCLKFLIYSAAFWTILIFVERSSTNAFVSYYANMLGYPLKFLLAFFTMCTILQYVGLKLPKQILYGALILLTIELVIAVTNSTTSWFLELGLSQFNTFDDLYTASKGALFFPHLIIIYSIVITALWFMFSFLAKHRDTRQYKAVTRMLVICVVVVLTFNASQLLFFESNVDLTYISLVVVSFILYIVIYSKDMVFNLKASGRGEILSNMREMYILTDRDKRIIEISPLLLEKYNILFDDIIGQKFETLETTLKEKVVLYSEHKIVEEENESKDHYHLREKEFKLKGMDDFGYMILLYDETQVYSLLRELNRLSNYDSMTGLNNRNYIEQKIEKVKSTKNLGVLSLDLNALKTNNDYLGHERGDYLLKSLANKMKAVFADVVEKSMARIGGDEFLVLIPNATEKLLEKKKQELLKACDNKAIEKVVSVSIGTSIDLEGKKSIYELIKEADKGMYEMKKLRSKAYSDEIIKYIEMQGKYIR